MIGNESFEFVEGGLEAEIRREVPAVRIAGTKGPHQSIPVDVAVGLIHAAVADFVEEAVGIPGPPELFLQDPADVDGLHGFFFAVAHGVGPIAGFGDPDLSRISRGIQDLPQVFARIAGDPLVV